MRICAISDLHGNLPTNLETCDYLLIAGDIVPLNIQKNMISSREWFLNDFVEWANSLDVKKCIYWIPGNHDFVMEYMPDDIIHGIEKKSNAHCLYNCGALLKDGDVEYKIFGTPFCSMFYNWAFNFYPKVLEILYSTIPDDIDIILSHDAPYGISDICYENRMKEHIGNPQLRSVMDRIKPKYLIHGHLHSSSHAMEESEYGTKVYNVSLLNEKYEMIYEPLYLDL